MNKKLLTCIVCIMFLLSACQPTPQQNIVDNKADGKIEEMISSAPIKDEQVIIETDANTKEASTEVGITSYKWEEEVVLHEVACSFDADVIIPEKTVFPVYKIKRHTFDQESVDAMINYFIKDATGVRETSDTKEELEEKLLNAKRGQMMVHDNEIWWEPYEGQEQDIVALEEQIANTLSEIFNPIGSTTLPMNNTYNLGANERVYIRADADVVFVSPVKYGTLQPVSWIVLGDAYPGEPVGTTLQNVKISEEEARAMTEAFLGEVGIEHMGIASCEKARILLDKGYETISEGWEIILARNDGGNIPVHIRSQTSALLYQADEEYIPRWYPETMRLYVDETGVRHVEWEHPAQVVETLNENVLVLDFKSIQEQIIKYMEYGTAGAKIKYGDVSKDSINVTQVVLTNVMIPVKNDLQHQLLVPAWIVYYDQLYDGNIQVSSFIAINAIDGSGVDMKVRIE